MRLLICYILILTLILQSCGNQEPVIDQNRIYLRGQVSGIADTTLQFSFETFSLLESSKSININIDSTGSFKLLLESKYPLKGYLSFGKVPETYKFVVNLVDGRDSSMQVESVDFRMVYLYLSPGDSLLMKVDSRDIKNKLSFSGRGAGNNYFVNHEEWEFNNYKNKYLNNYYYITYLQPEAYKLKKKEIRDSKNLFLYSFQKDYLLSDHLVTLYTNQFDQEMIRAMISYPENHAGFNEDKMPELPDDYYNFINRADIPDSIDNLGISACHYLNSLLRKKHELKQIREGDSIDFYDFIDSELPERLAFVFKAYSLDRDFRKELYEVFDESCPYPELISIVKQRYSHLTGMLEGSPGPVFELKDVSGMIHNLSDFKGNLVYIDFWATWCKPCIKEIPYLDSLQEEFKGHAIKFISISIDNEKDTLKWKDFVIQEEMRGVQLWADKAHHDMFSKNLNIKTIPRFVLLDAEGKIIDAQAPRPSDPILKALLSELTKR